LIITGVISIAILFVLVVGCRFSVVGCHGDCGWVGLLIITGVISIAILFVSVLGSRFWVVGCRLWVVGLVSNFLMGLSELEMLWSYCFRFSVVSFRLWVFRSWFLVLGFRLWVLGFHGDCGWVGLLIITGVILIFVSNLFVSVVGCRFSVFGFRLWVMGCGFSVLGSWFWVLGCGLSVVGFRFSR